MWKVPIASLIFTSFSAIAIAKPIAAVDRINGCAEFVVVDLPETSFQSHRAIQERVANTLLETKLYAITPRLSVETRPLAAGSSRWPSIGREKRKKHVKRNAGRRIRSGKRRSWLIRQSRGRGRVGGGNRWEIGFCGRLTKPATVPSLSERIQT